MSGDQAPEPCSRHRALLGACLAIASEPDPGAVASTLPERAVRALGVAAAALLLRDADGGLALAAQSGLGPDAAAAMRVRPDEDPATVLDARCAALGFESSALAPLATTPGGVLAVFSGAAGGEPEIQELLSALADHAAVGIQNARARRELERRAEELERANAELAHAETFHRAVLEQMPAALMLAEAPSGRLVFASHKMARILRRPAELVGSVAEYTAYPVFRPDGTPLSPEEYPLARSLTTGEEVGEMDHLIQLGDGERGRVRCCSAPIRDAAGRIVGAALSVTDVTESVRAEEALRESEDRFRRLVENVRDYAIYMLDPRGYVASWNEGAERITGYTAEEVLGRHHSVFYPQLDVLTGQPEAPLRVCEQKGFYEEEGWRVRKDGSRFWANVVLTTIRAKDGTARGFAKILRDTTEAKLVEEALHEANLRTANILESISDAFLAIDREWRFTFVNPEAMRLLSRSRTSLIGRTVREAFPELVGTQFYEALGKALAEGRSVEVEEHYAPLGRSLEMRVYPSAIGLSIYFRDVTERRQTERALRFLADTGKALAGSLDFDATLQAIVDVAVPTFADSCLAVVLDEDVPASYRFAIAHGDAAARARVLERFGQSVSWLQAPRGFARILRTGESELTPELTTEALAQTVTNCEDLDALLALELRSLVSVPLQARGRTLGVIGFGVSGRRERYGLADLALAEEVGRRAALAVDNARLYRDAQAAIQAREDMVSIASHDLRSPLSNLKLRAQMLLRSARSATGEAPPAPSLVRGLESIVEQTDRLAALTDFFLDLARISAGRLELRLEAVDLAELVRDVVARVSDEAARAGGAIALRAEAPVVGRWDRMRVEQIAMNLVTNAIKYGAGRPIEITVELADGQALLRVRDHGIGIAHEDMPFLFDRFRRAGDRNERAGFGLGLWIVHRVLDKLGGTIAVDSAAGDGSTFTIALPLGAERAEVARAA